MSVCAVESESAAPPAEEEARVAVGALRFAEGELLVPSKLWSFVEVRHASSAATRGS